MPKRLSLMPDSEETVPEKPRITKKRLEPEVDVEPEEHVTEHEHEHGHGSEHDGHDADADTDAEQEQQNDQDATAVPPETEEYEQVLTPQLQELLEYMADDEKVFMIKGSQMQAVASLIQQSLNLRETIVDITRKLHEVTALSTQLQQAGRELDQLKDSQLKALTAAKSRQESVPVPVPASRDDLETESVAASACSVGVSKVKVSTKVTTAPKVAVPAVVKQRAAAAAVAATRAGRGARPRKGAAPATASTSTSTSAKESLVELLEKYKKSTDADGSKKLEVNTEDAARLNSFFDMVYILNINGKGVKFGETLQGYGLTKCQVIEADLPKKVLPYQKPFHFMRDAVENAKENGYKNIIVLHDNIMPHKRFTTEFKEIADQFEEGGQAGDWDIIQFGFTRKVNNHKPTSFDWEYYTDAYPGLLLKSEKEAVKHWKQKGFRDGRIGAREIFQDEDLTHVFAVAISSNVFDKLLNQLEIGINNSKAEHNVIGGLKCIIYGVRPNLFIRLDPVLGDKPAEYKKFQWHLDSYLAI